jgi:hypothetical protein
MKKVILPLLGAFAMALALPTYAAESAGPTASACAKRHHKKKHHGKKKAAEKPAPSPRSNI